MNDDSSIAGLDQAHQVARRDYRTLGLFIVDKHRGVEPRSAHPRATRCPHAGSGRRGRLV